jgi:hypothetical protein
MDSLYPLVESSTETAPDRLTFGVYSAHSSTRFAAAAQAGQAQIPGALAPCRLWYIGTGRQSFRLSALPASALPGRQKLAMARKADTESLTDHLLPIASLLYQQNLIPWC